jgi:feruloyl esterase
MKRLQLPALIAAAGFCLAARAEATSCEDLTKLVLPATTITSAQMVAAGAFTPPPRPPGPVDDDVNAPTGGAGARGGAPGGRGRGGRVVSYRTLPEFCRVAAMLRPSSDSEIKVEVWMPATGWNGKFEGVGNGGWAGTIGYAAMAAAVAGGYATASTDTGHVGGSASFALGHPEKLADFGYRAVHEMTVQGKAIVDAFYGGAPKLAIWNACSTGGRQAITEAERYPADYDGIVAGASAIYSMAIHAARVAINVIAHRTDDSYIPPAKYAMVHAAVLEACDALDGVKDGVIDDPLRCRFDPKVLKCKDADAPTCLNNAQVETMRALYAPLKEIPGQPPLLQPGTELGWATLAGPSPLRLSVDAFKFVVFKDPSWDWHRFNATTDIARALKADTGAVSLTDPNLKPFFDRGGKLLMYHGWADPQVPAQNSVRYFNAVVKTAGQSVVGKSIELYMVPGMGHCRGGAGADTFDKMAAMEQWIAQGTAPAQIVASHSTAGAVDRTRPLCPFGQVAKWKGIGSTDEAANFACVAER